MRLHVCGCTSEFVWQQCKRCKNRDATSSEPRRAKLSWSMSLLLPRWRMRCMPALRCSAGAPLELELHGAAAVVNARPLLLLLKSCRQAIQSTHAQTCPGKRGWMSCLACMQGSSCCGCCTCRAVVLHQHRPFVPQGSLPDRAGQGAGCCSIHHAMLPAARLRHAYSAMHTVCLPFMATAADLFPCTALPHRTWVL